MNLTKKMPTLTTLNKETMTQLIASAVSALDIQSVSEFEDRRAQLIQEINRSIESIPTKSVETITLDKGGIKRKLED